MELNKTRCKSCGYLNKWYSYKWADTKKRQEHNRVNNTTCPKCGSTDVENIEDDGSVQLCGGIDRGYVDARRKVGG